jgi:hypothetical protein
MQKRKFRFGEGNELFSDKYLMRICMQTHMAISTLQDPLLQDHPPLCAGAKRVCERLTQPERMGL